VSAPAVPAGTRRFPPVAELVTGSLALTVLGGILMTSSIPRRPALGAPVGLAVAAVLLTLAGAVLTARLRDFNWGRFAQVFRWALLAYAISAGMIGFAFIRNHVSGAPLAVVLIMLVIYAADVPFIIAFTVARYSSPPHPAN
jgi:hypothetical protein